MEEIIRHIRQSVAKLVEEISNFQDIARYFKPEPGDLPELNGVDIYGESIPLNGLIGGDHIIYVDFKKRYDLEARIRKAQADGRLEQVEELRRCQHKAGIVLADVSGHRITDAVLAAALHQAFLLGTIYELDYCGNVTSRLFENLNTRFYRSSAVDKFLTMIYGEISEDGTFRFLSAGHPPPIVFSKYHNRIVDISPDRLRTFPPIGTLPSQEDIDRRTVRSVLGFKERYRVNELNLMGEGDILLLYTDGLSEHSKSDEDYCPDHLESLLRDVKDRSARDICSAIKQDLARFNTPDDDISYVVIKRA